MGKHPSHNSKQKKPISFKKRICTPEGWAHYVTWLFIMLFFALFPLLYTPAKYQNITEGKYYYFIVLTLSFAVLLGLRYISAFLTGDCKLSSPLPLVKKASFSQIAMAAYVLIAILSALLSDYPEDVWVGAGRFDGLYTILLYACLFYLISFFGKPSEWFIVGLGAGLVLFALIGLLQIWNINVLNLFPEGYSHYDAPFIGTLGNIDIVATYMCMVLPFLCVAVATSSQWWRYLLLLPIALGLYLEILINVDASKVGLLSCALVLIPMIFRNKKQIMDGMLVLAVIAGTVALGYATNLTPTPLEEGSLVVKTAFEFGKLHKLLLGAALLFLLIYFALRLYKGELKINPKFLTAVLAILIVLGLVFGIVYVYQQGANSSNLLICQANQIMHGNLLDEFGTYRMFVWKRALPMAVNGPLFGTGPDTFIHVFTAAFGDDVKALGFDQVYDFAHNDFIQIWSNLGPIALIAYLAIMVGLAVGFFRHGCRDRWTLMLGAAVIGYLVQSFFSFTIIIIAPMFYIMLGLLDGCNRRNRELQD